MNKAAITLVLVVAGLLVALASKSWLIAVPEVRADNTPGQFDTARAVGRLNRILGDQRPHPVDSDANDAVRVRLITELRAIGLAPRVTDNMVCNGSPKSRGTACARVRNVVATIGPREGRHVLVAVHYDSTPVGPGAADDGIGVASALEIAAILSRRKLGRPVTFLFDDGEESGLLGARAFLNHDPLADRVGALVNMEARGTTGPATMFETNLPNGAAIDHFARAVDNPSTNSLATDFARMIPNSTDVEVFKARNWTTLNFAIIGNETRYHSAGDTLAALDRRSVQHMGDQALVVIADLANNKATKARGTKVYSDFLGWFIVLPVAIGIGGVVLLLGAAAAMAWHRRKGLGRALTVAALSLPAAAGLTWVVHTIVRSITPGEFWRAQPLAISLAVAATVILACLALLIWRPTKRDALRVAYWLGFMLVGAGVTALAPGGSIFFLFPPLVALLGMALEPRIKGVEQVGAWIAVALLFLSFAPVLALSEILLDFDAAWMFAPIAVVIVFPVLIEVAPQIATLPRRQVLTAGSVLVAAAWLTTALLPDYSSDRRQQFGIEYVHDQRDRSAQWMVVNDGARLPERFRSVGTWASDTEVPWSTRKRHAVATRVSAAVPMPAVDLIGQRRLGQGRQVAFRLRANGADTVLLRAPPDARLIAARIGGALHRFGKGAEDAPFIVRCQGRSCDGAKIDVVAANRRPIEWTLMGLTSGLPAAAAPLVAARPVTATAQYTPDQSVSVTKFKR